MMRTGAVTALTLLALSTAGRSQPQDWANVAPEGATEIRLTRPGQKDARVSITTVRVSAKDRLFPAGESFTGLSEVSLVTDLKITVGSDDVFVWRSVFVDLVNPSRMTLRPQGRHYVLSVSCRDAAEAFRAEISFEPSHVTRRLIFSNLTPREASEDTRYRLTIFGQ